MKAKIKIENPFKDEKVNEYFEVQGKLNSYCKEYGIDSNGKVYFQYMNGITERFSRREFIKKARDERNVF
jgi:flagellar hook protein FlgE